MFNVNELRITFVYTQVYVNEYPLIVHKIRRSPREALKEERWDFFAVSRTNGISKEH